MAAQLSPQRLLGDHHAGGGGNDDGRDLGHQTVAHRQARINVRRLGERKALLGDADNHAADDVDEGDEKAGDDVAAHELGGAVHGAEEVAFFLQFPTPKSGLVLVDQARRKIGVDGHLLARHGVQGEAGRDLGDAAGALGDDDEIDDHQDGENDDADDEVAAHDEATEGLDHLAGGLGSLVPMTQDQSRRG